MLGQMLLSSSPYTLKKFSKWIPSFFPSPTSKKRQSLGAWSKLLTAPARILQTCFATKHQPAKVPIPALQHLWAHLTSSLGICCATACCGRHISHPIAIRRTEGRSVHKVHCKQLLQRRSQSLLAEIEKVTLNVVHVHHQKSNLAVKRRRVENLADLIQQSGLVS